MSEKIIRAGYQCRALDEKDWTYDGASRTISGYAAVFGNRDRAGDILLQGCFAKSIAERGPESNANGKILLLWQHDADEPLGRITVLREDEKGLYFEAVIDEIEIGDRCIKQLESGTLNQFSIGFSYVSDTIKYDEGQDAYLVGEVKLYEISVVSIAANPETEFLGMKALDDESAEDALRREVAEFGRGMGTEKQARLQLIISKAMALARAGRPQESAPADEPTAEAENNENKSLFDYL